MSLVTAATGLTTLAAAVAVVALARRDRHVDRLIALEVAIAAAAATVAAVPALGGSDRFVDLVVVLALVGFTSTLAAARYLEHRTGS